MMRFMMGGLGPLEESAELSSYLLFIPQFTKTLIEMGYNDVLDRKDEILSWIENSD